MKRREFIKKSVSAALSAAIGPSLVAKALGENPDAVDNVVAGSVIDGAQSCAGKSGNPTNNVEKHLEVQGYVREPALNVPVVASADVIVIGGGAAGVASAVCAAREGASVILVEKANFLGGLWTGGLVLPVLATHAVDKNGLEHRAMYGFGKELCDSLLDKGWAVNPRNPLVEPEAAKYLMDKVTMEAGVKMVYNAVASSVVMCGDRIEAVTVDCNTGRIALKGKVFVDASGDGCLFNFTGDPHEDRLYHISTSYRTGGSSSRKCGWKTPVDEMKFKTYGSRRPEDGLDIFRVSQLQQEHRIGVWNRVEELKKDPECQNAYLMECAPVTGIRVTRVLDSLCNVTLEGSMEWQEYEDVIGYGGMCDPFNYKGQRITGKNRPLWQIPYRSLLPRKTENLLVAGRCFGYDQGITWDAREISTCLTTGEAAGVGAAMAANLRCAASEVPITQLQHKLNIQDR